MMPYVLIHKQNRKIYSCTLVNLYKLPYYGAKYWDSEAEALQEAGTFLSSQGESEPDAWEPMEVEEHRLKLFNVKLANNPSRAIRIEENGQIQAYTPE